MHNPDPERYAVGNMSDEEFYAVQGAAREFIQVNEPLVTARLRQVIDAVSADMTETFDGEMLWAIAANCFQMGWIYGECSGFRTAKHLEQESDNYRNLN